MGEYKLQDLKENPPGLDIIPVRVSEKAFKDELLKTNSICEENEIQLLLFLVFQDPSAYDLLERAQYLYDLDDPQEAIELIEEAFNTIPSRSFSFSRYLLGLSYEKVGMMQKSQEAFQTHQPSGSIFGEAVLRSERHYFDIMRDIADEYSLTLVDGKQAIIGEHTSPVEAEKVFRKEFVDECHYTVEGHRRMGLGLAQSISNLITSSTENGLQPSP